MAKNTKFTSNTKKEEHRIGDSDLYYFQIHHGVNMNGYSSYLDYLNDVIAETYDSKTPDTSSVATLEEFKSKIESGELEYESYTDYLQDIIATLQKKAKNPTQRGSRTLRKNSWVIYRKDPNDTYEEFVEKVNNGELRKVGDLEFTPINQDLTFDSNGNLVLKTMNSDLEDYSHCGDVLISRTGEVLRNSRGSFVIKKPNQYGFYPVDVFRGEEDPTTGDKRIVRIETNFLDKNGRMICRDNFIRPRSAEEEKIICVDRNYTTPTGRSVKGIYPRGYVLATRDNMSFYPSAVDLIIANREALANGEPPLIAREEPFLEDLYRRQLDGTLSKKAEFIMSHASDEGAPYREAHLSLIKELENIQRFSSGYETPADIQIRDSLDFSKKK